MQRQVAGRLGLLDIGDHRRLRSRAGDRREELGVLEVDPFLQPQRTAGVGGTLDRRDGRLHPPSETIREGQRAVE
jgi:hypothetical protein